MLDGANDPDTAIVSMSVPQGDSDWKSADINVYVPMVIASIKMLRGMGTVESRSIHIQLKRATKRERANLVKARRRELKPTLEPLADRCARWAEDNASKLVGMDPAINFDDGRDEDKWEPLIGIADYLDASLGERVRDIATAMIGQDATNDQPFAVQLLTDIKVLFERKRVDEEVEPDKYSSLALCLDLAKMPDRPWQALSAGRGRERKPINQNRLASMLRDFGIASHTIRMGASTAKGYERKDFEDSWERYPPDKASEEDEAEDQPPEDEPPEEKPPEDPEDPPSNTTHAPIFPDPKRNNVTTQRGVRESGVFQSVTEPLCDGSENSTSPYGEKECDAVTDQIPEHGDARTQTHGDQAPSGAFDSDTQAAQTSQQQRLPYPPEAAGGSKWKFSRF